LLAPRPAPKLEGHTLSAVRDCLFNIFAATLHPQPEDAPCLGDRRPPNIHVSVYFHHMIKFILNAFNSRTARNLHISFCYLTLSALLLFYRPIVCKYGLITSIIKKEVLKIFLYCVVQTKCHMMISIEFFKCR
jgi:hypothetical protein